MAWVQADLDLLEKQFGSPERRVRYSDGREVEYKSTSEMEMARQIIKSALSAAAVGAYPIRQTRFFSSKGL